MTASFTFTSYGAAATAALTDAIAAAKGNDPLAPVTVVVPSNLVGVAARRSLATDPDTGGLAAVRFETLLGLAKLLAGSTPAVFQAVVDNVKAKNAGLLVKSSAFGKVYFGEYSKKSSPNPMIFCAQSTYLVELRRLSTKY